MKNLKTRALRVRRQIRAVSTYPRLTVFRSNVHIWAQVVDDQKGLTLASASDSALKKGTKTEKAQAVGQALAENLLKQGVKQVVFDRGGYRFHGRVKSLAEAVRAQGVTI